MRAATETALVKQEKPALALAKRQWPMQCLITILEAMRLISDAQGQIHAMHVCVPARVYSFYVWSLYFDFGNQKFFNGMPK